MPTITKLLLALAARLFASCVTPEPVRETVCALHNQPLEMRSGWMMDHPERTDASDDLLGFLGAFDQRQYPHATPFYISQHKYASSARPKLHHYTWCAACQKEYDKDLASYNRMSKAQREERIKARWLEQP